MIPSKQTSFKAQNLKAQKRGFGNFKSELTKSGLSRHTFRLINLDSKFLCIYWPNTIWKTKETSTPL